MYTTKTPIDLCRVFHITFDPQLKKILTFSVKDRYQLNYFICIKDFNAETNTFFICGCQHHQRKMICLYVDISDIRQIVGYLTPVFIQRFPWRLHITITYNLLHLRLMLCWRCHSNSVNTGSRLPICSDVKTRKRRNVVGIDMIRNNRIAPSLNTVFFSLRRSLQHWSTRISGKNKVYSKILKGRSSTKNKSMH